MPVLGMMLPTHQPHPKEGMYMQLLVPKMSPLLRSPTKHSSLKTQIPSDDFYQLHQAKHSKRTSKPLSGFQRDPSKKTTPTPPKKPFKKYDGPVYVPAEAYKLLSPEAVVALKKYNTEAINKFSKKRGIHVTDIADQEPLPSEDTTPEEQHDPHQFDDA